MRSQLLAALTTATATLSQFSVSQELPWESNGQPLYLRNLRKLYVDETRLEQTVLIPVLSPDPDVMQNTLITQVFVAMDAKNPPSQLNQLINQVLAARKQVNVVNFGTESDYVTETQEDRLLLTFEFRVDVATT
jgi:hypothetical protein